MKFHDVKFTVVSATVDKTVYEYYFSQNSKNSIDFYECKLARYEGDLIQYYDKTMSTSYVRDNLHVYFEIEKKLGKMNRITFKDFAGSDPIYFHKTEGCDFYKGQHIQVIGTPHLPPWTYPLIALTIGLECDASEEWSNQKVSHNGCTFNFMTFKDEALRSIQFYLIEGELEQAVGRARLLRFDCTVYLFSNFPLRQSQFGRFWGYCK
jgi:hypothetical protein